MDNYYVPVENRQNKSLPGKMFLSSMVLTAITVISIIMKQTVRVAIMLIRTTFYCILAIFFINPYPRWK